MFDIGGSELLLIGLVAVVVVGPKELPKMLRTFGQYSAKARRVANDFRRQFDEALREAELDDVKKSVEEMSKIDPLAEVKDSFAGADKITEDIRTELAKPMGPASAAPIPEPAVEAGAAAEPAAPQIGTPVPVTEPTPVVEAEAKPGEPAIAGAGETKT